MLDQLMGRPSGTTKRLQVFLVMLFWVIQLRWRTGPYFLRRLGKPLTRYTPWQIVVGTCSALYALRNLNSILGFASPEPLARLYSKDYFRATYIAVAMDTGFATAMPIRIKWIRDIASVLFSLYYLVYANEADEKLRKFRAISTVEMLRVTWEKTANPYLRFVSSFDRPRVSVKRRLVFKRPTGSPYHRSVTAWLYYSGKASTLAECKNLILDFPGGGFICMNPEHHEERILRWTKQTGFPVLSLDYSKAPEFPYPYAIHEGLDIYRLLVESKGRILGFGQGELNIILTGDSAGANLATAVLLKILEMPAETRLTPPVALIYAYPALDFNYSSWMTPSSLAVLKQAESSVNLKGITEQKDHFSHRSPLAIVDDKKPRRRTKSWSKSFSRLPLIGSGNSSSKSAPRPRSETDKTPQTPGWAKTLPRYSMEPVASAEANEAPTFEDEDDEDEYSEREEDKSMESRVKYWAAEKSRSETTDSQTMVEMAQPKKRERLPMETRLTMTSRTACFNDRILSAPMMRSMALCYIGPRNSPDLSTNYYISPILAPNHLLAQFPPVYLICGEKDPLSDDTIILAGRLREAKMARKTELKAKATESSAKSKRDPILDETERDWVHMKILQGWSHGFLQMVTILRAAEEPIALMADWIESAFAKQQRKRDAEYRLQVPESAIVLDDDEPGREDEVLSFTARKRTGSHARVNRTGSQSTVGQKTSDVVASEGTSPGALQSPGLEHLGVNDESGKTKRRGSNNGPEYVDDGLLLRRRRADIVAELNASSDSETHR